MEKNSINDFSLNELHIVKDYIQKIINIKTKQNMNNRLTIELMEKLHFFDSEMFEILKRNGVKNIQDLIDTDLSKWNLETQRRIELEEAKKWYDLSRMEEENHEDEDDYRDIDIKVLFGIIYNDSFRYLKRQGITTVGEFLDAGNVIASMHKSDIRMQKDILTAYKLLRCKYLNIDPGMEIKDNDTMANVGHKLGFRNKTYKAFLASGLSPKKLKSIVMNNDEIDACKELLKIENVGNLMAREIIFKISIVSNYYNKNNIVVSDKKLVDLDAEELKKEYFEALELNKRIGDIGTRLDNTLDVMLDMMISQGILPDGKSYEKNK